LELNQLIDLQSSDATRVALRETTILDFSKYVFQWHLSVWRTICWFTHVLKHLWKLTKAAHESTGTTV